MTAQDYADISAADKKLAVADAAARTAGNPPHAAPGPNAPPAQVRALLPIAAHRCTILPYTTM